MHESCSNCDRFREQPSRKHRVVLGYDNQTRYSHRRPRKFPLLLHFLWVASSAGENGVEEWPTQPPFFTQHGILQCMGGTLQLMYRIRQNRIIVTFRWRHHNWITGKRYRYIESYRGLKGKPVDRTKFAVESQWGSRRGSWECWDHCFYLDGMNAACTSR